MILGNTYHLALRPGEDVVAALGGLHAFFGWSGPILTDSGGFQIYSLAAAATITEQAALFRSHIDGSLVELSPERAVAIQEALGSDVAMVLDECLAYPVAIGEARVSMERTLRWAERARQRMASLRQQSADGVTVTNAGQAQFGIVQGGVFQELRDESAARTVALGFEGYALGGLSVGEPPDEMYRIVGDTTPRLPAHHDEHVKDRG